MIRLSLYLFIFSIFSCSHVNTLNLQQHDFGNKPAKIIWIQIAGLSEEHFAMLRFGMSEANKKTAFEQMECIGKTWNYNLYKLRPSISEGFRAQLLGTPNIKNRCSDFKEAPLWDNLSKLGYKTGILESSRAGENSFYEVLKCKQDWKNLLLWRMASGQGGKSFHYQEKKKFKFGETYYDKSCEKGACYSTIYDNAKSLEQYLGKRYDRTLFLIRDFNYADALERGKIFTANEILLEYEKILAYFLNKYQSNEETLVLVTSTAARNIEFPKQGKEWVGFAEKGKNVLFKNRSLLSPVFASGASSENFCGMYDEHEILYRLFWMTNTSRIEQSVKDFF